MKRMIFFLVCGGALLSGCAVEASTAEMEELSAEEELPSGSQAIGSEELAYKADNCDACVMGANEAGVCKAGQYLIYSHKWCQTNLPPFGGDYVPCGTPRPSGSCISGQW